MDSNKKSAPQKVCTLSQKAQKMHPPPQQSYTQFLRTHQRRPQRKFCRKRVDFIARSGHAPRVNSKLYEYRSEREREACASATMPPNASRNYCTHARARFRLISPVREGEREEPRREIYLSKFLLFVARTRCWLCKEDARVNAIRGWYAQLNKVYGV